MYINQTKNPISLHRYSHKPKKKVEEHFRSAPHFSKRRQGRRQHRGLLWAPGAVASRCLASVEERRVQPQDASQTLLLDFYHVLLDTKLSCAPDMASGAIFWLKLVPVQCFWPSDSRATFSEMPWLCFGRRDKSSKRPSISPPLHLLLKVSSYIERAFFE